MEMKQSCGPRCPRVRHWRTLVEADFRGAEGVCGPDRCQLPVKAVTVLSGVLVGFLGHAARCLSSAFPQAPFFPDPLPDGRWRWRQSSRGWVRGCRGRDWLTVKGTGEAPPETAPGGDGRSRSRAGWPGPGPRRRTGRRRFGGAVLTDLSTGCGSTGRVGRGSRPCRRRSAWAASSAWAHLKFHLMRAHAPAHYAREAPIGVAGWLSVGPSCGT